MNENRVKDEVLEEVDGGLTLEKRPIGGTLASEMVKAPALAGKPYDDEPERLRGGNRLDTVRETLAENLAEEGSVDAVQGTRFLCGKQYRVGR